jgi:putative phage-type endonuclease
MFTDTRELVQGTPEWREARIGRITGSMVGAILGVSPFTTRRAALKRMVKEAMGELDDFTNAAMEWGTQHEETSVKLYEALYLGSETIAKTGYWYKGDVGASPDRLVGADGLLEIKCPYSKRDDERPTFEAPTSAILPHYWHQVQAQLYVTDRQWCDFLQWTPHDHHICRIRRDPEWLDNHIDEFAKFMQEFEDMRHQMASGGPSERLALSEGWDKAARLYAQAVEEEAQAKLRKEAARAALVSMAEAAEVDHVDGSGAVLSKVTKKGSVDWQGLAKDLIPADIEFNEEDYRKKGSTSWRINLTKGDS